MLIKVRSTATSKRFGHFLFGNRIVILKDAAQVRRSASFVIPRFNGLSYTYTLPICIILAAGPFPPPASGCS